MAYRARLESVSAPKGHRGFKSHPLRHFCAPAGMPKACGVRGRRGSAARRTQGRARAGACRPKSVSGKSTPHRRIAIGNGRHFTGGTHARASRAIRFGENVPVAESVPARDANRGGTPVRPPPRRGRSPRRTPPRPPAEGGGRRFRPGPGRQKATGRARGLRFRRAGSRGGGGWDAVPLIRPAGRRFRPRPASRNRRCRR